MLSRILFWWATSAKLISASPAASICVTAKRVVPSGTVCSVKPVTWEEGIIPVTLLEGNRPLGVRFAVAPPTVLPVPAMGALGLIPSVVKALLVLVSILMNHCSMFQLALPFLSTMGTEANAIEEVLFCVKPSSLHDPLAVQLGYSRVELSRIHRQSAMDRDRSFLTQIPCP